MRKILVVEDDEIIRDAYVTTLLTEAYQVDSAENGRVAVELCKEKHYDLILLDLMMPEMNGIEFMETFKPEENPRTKIIVTTNLSTGEMLQDAIKLGAYRNITKSDVSPRQLLTIVRYEVDAS